jgi:hypothetical protein
VRRPLAGYGSRNPSTTKPGRRRGTPGGADGRRFSGKRMAADSGTKTRPASSKGKIKPVPDLAERRPSGAGGGALSGGARTQEPRRASGGITRKTGGANGMKTHNEKRRLAVSPGETARMAAPLNEKAQRKTAAARFGTSYSENRNPSARTNSPEAARCGR